MVMGLLVGVIGSHLANYGTDNPASDFNLRWNSRGRGYLYFNALHRQQYVLILTGGCREQTTILGVVLEEYYVHETDILQNIPSGS